jgi:hypothetical protein
LARLQAQNAAAKAAGKVADKTTVHNIVLVDTALRVVLTAPAKHAIGQLSMDLGGFILDINSDGTVSVGVAPNNVNLIGGAKKDGTGDDGKADLMLRTEDVHGKPVVYIWEIKSATPKEEQQAPAQLQRYINETTGGRPGWSLNPSLIPDGRNGYIKAWSKSNDDANPLNVGNGIRLYGDGGNQNKNGNQPFGPAGSLWGFLGLGGLLAGAGAGISTGGGSGSPRPAPPVPAPQPVAPNLGIQIRLV